MFDQIFGDIEILNISIDPEKLDLNDKEQLEDFLVIGINEALQLAEAKQQEHSQSLIKDVMPGGLDKLFGQ